MDEPTSAISDTEVAMLFRQIADLTADGVTVIYIAPGLGPGAVRGEGGQRHGDDGRHRPGGHRGCGVGALTGLINGVVITFSGIPSFIMTLATTTVARGISLLYTGSSPISGLGNFKLTGQGSLGPFPI